MRKLLSAIILASLGVAAPALAQETRAPFTGPRVEGLLGYDHINDGGGQDASSSNGLLYGVGVGYDMPAGNFTVGAEGEFSNSTADTRTDDVFTPGDRFRVDAGRDLYVGGRVGYVLSPRTLAYAKAGYTNARVEARYDAGTVRVRDHSNLDGYRLGVGLEQAISGGTYIKGEYRYSHYGDIDGYDSNLDRHQLVAGLGIRF